MTCNLYNKLKIEPAEIKQEMDENAVCRHFHCDRCTKDFENRQELIIHRNSQCERNRWKCFHCKKEFDSESRLEKHSFVHVELPVTCGECGEVSSTLHQLMSHEHMQGSQTCFHCGQVFSRSLDCQNHKLYCHPDVGWKVTSHLPFVCAICGKGFKLQCLLVIHLFSHSQGKSKECAKCGMKFNFVSTLKDQTLKSCDAHFRCSICDDVFQKSSSLRRHVLTHVNRKPYRCSVCCKEYKYFRSFQSHKLLHAGQKRWTCGFCGELFAMKEDFAQHLMTHDMSDGSDAEVAELLLQARLKSLRSSSLGRKNKSLIIRLRKGNAS